MPKRRTGSIWLRGKVYWIKYVDQTGETIQESSGARTRLEAERFLNRRLGEVATGKFSGLQPERVTFAELAPLIVEDYLENKRKSLVSVERRLKLHLLPQLGKIRAAEFSSSHLKRYRELRRKQKAENGSINRELAIVKRVFNLALQQDPPFVARKPYVKMLEEKNVRSGFLDRADYARFREALPEELRLLLVLAYHIGTRTGELLPLQWSQVDLEEREITLNPGETKNDEGRVAPIYGDMLPWLQMAKSIRDQNYPKCPWVFHRAGQPIRSFRTSWDKAAMEAGVEGLLPHDLRRSAARNMSRARIPDKIIMAVCGWKTRAILDRYNVVSRADLALVRERMEEYLAGGIATESQQSAPKSGEKGAKEAAKLLN